MAIPAFRSILRAFFVLSISTMVYGAILLAFELNRGRKKQKVFGEQFGLFVFSRGTVVVVMMAMLVATLQAPMATGSQRKRVIVGFKTEPNPSLFERHGGEIERVYESIPALSGSIPEAEIDVLRAEEEVAYVELDGEVYILVENLPWGVDRIDAEKVHPYDKGTGVRVAVIDSGIDNSHPDLYCYGGYDWVREDNDPDDEHGHGTHVSGTIAALNNDIGVIGVAPEAHIYALKVLDETGSGYVSDVVAAIDWSITHGMQIINMSIGTDTDFASMRDACQAAWENGLVLVAAAGNDYKKTGPIEWNTVDYPAAYDSVIAVGATDNTDTKASWSSTGPELELAAPGVDITSTLPTYEVTMSADYGYDYGKASGTSMSAPHVAGTAALVWAQHPDWSNVEVRSRLDNTAEDLGDPGWDRWYGYGLVDAYEAAPPLPVIIYWSGTQTVKQTIIAVA
jgi:subtilisin family serine protease